MTLVLQSQGEEVMAQNNRQTLKEIGSKLANPPHSKDSLVKLLKVRVLTFFLNDVSTS